MSTPENPNGGGGGNTVFTIVVMFISVALTYGISVFLQRHFDIPLILRWVIIIAVAMGVGAIANRIRR